MNTKALSAIQIEQRLDTLLDVEFSFIKTREAANVLAELHTEKQNYILQWVQRVASTNIQLAYQFTLQAINALEHLDRTLVETWALHAMDTYDKKGLHPALEVIQNVQNFVQLHRAKTVGVSFEDKALVLTHFVHGLSGRKLEIKTGENCFTDTQTLFLPGLIALFEQKNDNFLLYKVTVGLLWAQSRFGTFRYSVIEQLLQHPQKDKILPLYHCMETLRLEYRLETELPGLYRDLLIVKEKVQAPPLSQAWQEIEAKLRQTQSDSQLSLDLSEQLLSTLKPYPHRPYQGVLDLEKTQECLQQRLLKDRARLRTALDQLQKELSDDKRRLKFESRPQKEDTHNLDMELVVDGQALNPPPEIKNLLSSVMQDLGEIPDEYLHPAGPGEYDPSLLQDQEEDPADVWKGTYHEKGAYLYNEWDFRRQHYRKNWCAVRELDITPKQDDFVSQTLQKYYGLIKHLRKTFEALRDENRNLKRQYYGDNIDLDALVEALAEARDGREMSERLFTRMHRVERNIAVCFMVDMSGSTKGWINDAERESLILLAETLETLGDKYAIYGFSGIARKRCEIYKIKTFEEPYNEEIKGRISAIEPKDYTRMGFAIRHLGRILNEVEARTRILITLSDGKPDDYDNYRGEYGIEDTRRALIEIRRDGIHPYCITIDKEARDYLPHMYGPAAYTVINDVRQLPLKVSDIYRRLTT